MSKLMPVVFLSPLLLGIVISSQEVEKIATQPSLTNLQPSPTITAGVAVEDNTSESSPRRGESRRGASMTVSFQRLYA